MTPPVWLYDFDIIIIFNFNGLVMSRGKKFASDRRRFMGMQSFFTEKLFENKKEI
jgi:hypothetical protein